MKPCTGKCLPLYTFVSNHQPFLYAEHPSLFHAIALVRRGHQVCFYKRAQIFVADVWGAFGGQGAGAFSDIGALTMFADYRVPAQLRTMDLLEYSPGLASRVRTCEGGRGEVVGSSWGGPLANSPML